MNSGTVTYILMAYSILMGLLIGCAHAPIKIAAPPATTQESCQQMKEAFKGSHENEKPPAEMREGCQLRYNATADMARIVDRRLQEQGWLRVPEYRKGPVPSEVTYETPSTRCAMAQLVDTKSSRSGVNTGVGISAGSGYSTTFGVGLGLGAANDLYVDYKIDCTKR